eukprot:TRINITY_DN37666_c0_g1_i3.p1 TRINITY_DN37666_c0_g1~~TRINITY_DN37666_c0_g1_i3.p1  ORF type:complete len:699 (+),score=207.07 TRINITY_DN37666_c0_g1_i3:1107-3203(+)
MIRAHERQFLDEDEEMDEFSAEHDKLKGLRDKVIEMLEDPDGDGLDDADLLEVSNMKASDMLHLVSMLQEDVSLLTERTALEKKKTEAYAYALKQLSLQTRDMSQFDEGVYLDPVTAEVINEIKEGKSTLEKDTLATERRPSFSLKTVQEQCIWAQILEKEQQCKELREAMKAEKETVERLQQEDVENTKRRMTKQESTVQCKEVLKSRPPWGDPKKKEGPEGGKDDKGKEAKELKEPKDKDIKDDEASKKKKGRKTKVGQLELQEENNEETEEDKEQAAAQRLAQMVTIMKLDQQKAKEKPWEMTTWLSYTRFNKDMQRQSLTEYYRIEVDNSFAEGHLNAFEDLESRALDSCKQMREALQALEEVALATRHRVEVEQKEVKASEDKMAEPLMNDDAQKLLDSLAKAKFEDTAAKAFHDSRLSELKAEEGSLKHKLQEIEAQNAQLWESKKEALAEEQRVQKEIEDLFYTLSHTPTFQGANDAKALLMRAQEIGIALPSLAGGSEDEMECQDDSSSAVSSDGFDEQSRDRAKNKRRGAKAKTKPKALRTNAGASLRRRDRRSTTQRKSSEPKRVSRREKRMSTVELASSDVGQMLNDMESVLQLAATTPKPGRRRRGTMTSAEFSQYVAEVKTPEKVSRIMMQQISKAQDLVKLSKSGQLGPAAQRNVAETLFQICEQAVKDYGGAKEILRQIVDGG